MDFSLETLHPIVKVLVFIGVMGLSIFFMYLADRIFSDPADMILDVRRFRKNHPDEYE
jgi:hypothetical protein